jgi:REP element-mobilizing transposase RayT
MPYNPDIHHRRSVRLQEYDYSQAGLYFITLCAQNHECVFGNIVNGKMILNEYGKITNDCWLEIPQHYQNIVLHEFVIMPNHIHGILEIAANGVECAVGANYYSPFSNNHNISPFSNKQNISSLSEDHNNNILENEGETDKKGVDNIIDNKRANNNSPLRQRRPRGTSGTIGAIVRGFKIGVSKRTGYSIWQRNYHEHIIRNRNRHSIIVDYINNNPAKWENDKFYAN